MVAVKKEGIVIHKSGLPFEIEGVLNPAVIAIGNDIHVFQRSVGNGNFSTIGYCRLSDPKTIAYRLHEPFLSPQYEYESQGMEDARIVKIDGLYYLSYTAYDGINAMGALAISKDLEHFEKKGIIVPQVSINTFLGHIKNCKCYPRYVESITHLPPVKPDSHHHSPLLWDKNLIFFPGRINGKLYFLHRIKPDIQISAVNSIEELTAEYWNDYLNNFDDGIFLTSKYQHEKSYVGGGCPPIETDAGWLIIYHGVETNETGNIYSACVALFALDNPQKEIARLPYPLFSPEEKWEVEGEVNNVCFPTGAVLKGDELFIYYGAADEHIALCSVKLSELITDLLKNKTQDEK